MSIETRMSWRPSRISDFHLTPHGVSSEAVALREELRDVETMSRMPPSSLILQKWFRDKERKEVFKELEEIAVECSEVNWDGHGAVPVSRDAVDAAKRFLGALPFYFPLPEVIPEPDGDVGLEWHTSENRWAVVSAHAVDELHYAMARGDKVKNDGRSTMDEGQIAFLIEMLRAIVG